MTEHTHNNNTPNHKNPRHRRPFRNNHNKPRQQSSYHRHSQNSERREPQDDFQTAAPVVLFSMTKLMQEKKLPAPFLKLQAQKDQLNTKIQAMKNRLTFGYSGPLHQTYTALLKQDLALSCQLNEMLLGKPCIRQS